MNRKAQIFGFLIAIGVFIICGFALFKFLTVGPEIKNMLVAPANLLELYQSEEKFNFFIKESGKLAVVNAYSSIVNEGKFASEGAEVLEGYTEFDNLNPDLNREFSNLIKKNIDKFIQQVDLEFQDIDYKIEVDGGNINFKAGEKEISSSTIEGSIYSATYNFNPSFSLILTELNLTDFSEIHAKFDTCNKGGGTLAEIESCMQDLENFDVKVSKDGERTLFDLTSKKRFFLESADRAVYEPIMIKFSS